MTAPRQVLRGTTYLITRRCLLREHFLRPDLAVSQTFSFVLAVAAQRYDIKVHAFCVLSNHYHLIVTDPDARLPAFQQYLGSFVARAINALRGRKQTFWEPNTFNAVALGSPDDIVAKAAYTLTNPVAAGLVSAGHLWPGLWSSPTSIGTTLKVRRPAHFFDPAGPLPDAVDLPLEVPPGFASAADFQRQLQAELSWQEQAARLVHSEFLGVARVLAQEPNTRPTSPEPRRWTIPRIAAQDRGKRIEMLRALKRFLADYREALQAWRDALVDPVFPAGTYLMRVAHGVACASSC
jgi:REP element-mobilizing transposase RayT